LTVNPSISKGSALRESAGRGGFAESPRLRLKRAKELELVVIDKRAKIKSQGYLTVIAKVESLERRCAARAGRQEF
jgi:hypothetical protein